MSVTCAVSGFSSQSASDFYHTPFMLAQMLAIAAKDTDKLKETLSLLGELESELAASHVAMDKQFFL